MISPVSTYCNQCRAPIQVERKGKLKPGERPVFLCDDCKGEATMVLGQTCDDAASLLTGDRDDSYGNPAETYQRVADLFEILTDITLDGGDIVLIFMLAKLSRESFKHKADNLVDLCGYADILNYIREHSTDESL